MEIHLLNSEEEYNWDQYLLNSNSATFYHQIGWKNVVEKTYGHKPFYLLAEEGGKIKGILPLFLTGNKIIGRKFVSIPFAPYGGICADNYSIEQSLIEKVKKMTKELNVDYFEIRSKIDMEGDFKKSYQYYTLILELENNSELVWNKFNNKIRNAIRKGIKNDLDFDIGNSYYDDFYRIYSNGMRDLGTPTHKYSFFKNLLMEFPEQTKIAVIKYKNNVIAGIFLLYFKDTIISGWASSDKSQRELSPNNLIYWETIKSGCESGFKYFDFGKSIFDSGTYRFKIPWNAEVTQLYYHYYLNKTKKVPDLSQESEHRKLFAQVYRKIPIQLANVIGPKLRKEFP